MPSWKKGWGQITIRGITGDYCTKSDSKEEDRGSGTVVCSVASRRNDSGSDKLSTRHDKEKQNACTVVSQPL